MLRAISEIAAAITVWSPALKPTSAASSRPCCRALTTSTSDAMVMASSSDMIAARLDLAVEEHESFLKIQCGRHPLEGEAELDHGEGDLGLDADDHRLRAAQARHVGEVAQRPHREGVHHVERGHVHDHTAGAELPHPRHQRLTQLREIGVG